MRTPLFSLLFAGAAVFGSGLASAQLNGNTEMPRGSLASSDVNFLQTADAANMDQLMLAKRTASRAIDPGVRALADNIAQSYAKANNTLVLLAGAKHVDLPHKPSSKGSEEADALLDRHGPLDRAYVEYVRHNTDDLIAAYEDARANSQDADIRAFADQMLPTLQNHKRQVADLIARKGD